MAEGLEPEAADGEQNSNVRIYVRVKPVREPASALSLDDSGTGVDFTFIKQGCVHAEPLANAPISWSTSVDA